MKLNKKAISVVSSFDNSEYKKYWLSKSKIERLNYIEELRKNNYGNKATQRLQRILKVVKKT
jgi:hypothetical protein